MAKPESNFIARVHRRLISSIYKQAMGLTSTNGTPDYYYESTNGYLWIEYKWFPAKPKVINLLDPKKKPHLSPLQRLWLNRAATNNINVMVIAGFPGNGCFILTDGAWNKVQPVAKYERPFIDIVSTINDLNRGTGDSRKT